MAQTPALRPVLLPQTLHHCMQNDRLVIRMSAALAVVN
jgi:hypothetical protein